MAMNLIHKISLSLAVAVSAFSALFLPVHSQDSGIRTHIVSIADDVYPQARAIISVEDASGAPATTLTKDDVSITIDNQPTSIVGVDLLTSDSAPLDLLLVIDTSGSMAGAPLAGAQAAARALLAELGAQDRVALMHFGDRVALAQDFTADRALITNAIDGLGAQGNTALYQATAASAVKIGTSGASRRVVVLLSDGADFGGMSTATRAEALAAAASVGVPFFTIAQGNDLDIPYLQALADGTKGRLLQAPRPQDLEALYVSIGRLLRSQYVITFDASLASIQDGSHIAITVALGEQTATADAVYQPAPNFLPVVDIDGLTAGETLTLPREIKVNVSSGSPHVTWYVDDVNVMELDAPPYVYTFYPDAFEGGDHRLRIAVGDGPSRIESGISFSSVAPASSGGSSMLLYALVAAAMVVGGGGFIVLKRRKPRVRETRIPADQRLKSWATQVAEKSGGVQSSQPEVDSGKEDIGVAMGRLVSRAGNDAGKEYLVGGKPVSIGASPRCGVRIDDPELASEEARIWVRGRHLMLHKFTRLTTLEAEGVTGGWHILEPGDTFEIGQHTFEYRSLEASGEGAPDPLSGADQPRPGRLSDLMPRAD
jgi:VWFA-related protein